MTRKPKQTWISVSTDRDARLKALGCGPHRYGPLEKIIDAPRISLGMELRLKRLQAECDAEKESA